MLLNNLYHILDQKTDLSSIRATVVFNADHAVFKGHFPGRPVVPGVCMIQAIREMMEDILETSLRIVAADNIKFLNMIDPSEKKSVTVDIYYKTDQNNFEITATLQHQATIFFKFQGIFRKM
jgi:3-hydroxyacyl-[acyl-carrier-protein] dehydratase